MRRCGTNLVDVWQTARRSERRQAEKRRTDWAEERRRSERASSVVSISATIFDFLYLFLFCS